MASAGVVVPAMLMENVREAVFRGLLLSITVIPKVKLPAVDGVPKIEPILDECA